MNKLDSVWYHEGKGRGKLASSHLAVLFCSLVKNNMIVDDLISMKFDKISGEFYDRSISPLEYFLAYTDGVILDIYIKAKYRNYVNELYSTNQAFEIMYELDGLMHDNSNDIYTLLCNWHNVDVLSEWLVKNIGRHNV